MSLRNMNIAPRALLGFSLIGLLMIVLGVFSLIQMSHIRAAGQNIENNTVPSITSLDELTQLTLRLRVLSYRLLLNREADIQQKTVQLFDQRNAQINQAQARYEKMISSGEEQAAYDDYKRLLGQYRQLESRMKSFSANGQVEELRTMLNSDMLGNSEQVNAVLEKLVKINNVQTR